MRVQCFSILLTILFFASVKSDEDPETRVVAGDNVDIRTYPYLVSVTITKKIIIYYFCGCIISEYFVLTTASCTSLIGDISEVDICAGSNTRKDCTSYSIRGFITHPRYNDSPNNFDIGILKLLNPFVLGDTINIIAVAPKMRGLATFSEITACGFGGHKNGRLQCVELTVQPLPVCILLYKDFTTEMFCAGNLVADAQGGSMGDAGGPAIQDCEGTPCVVGLFSLGRGCSGDTISNIPALSPTIFAKTDAECNRDIILEYCGF